MALHDDGNARLIGGLAERLWNRAARLLRRQAATGWDERLVGFRREAVGLLRRRWLALTRATLAGHLTVFLVLLVALRAVGVPSADVSPAEVFAAWALIRILTTVPITPGGLGVVELGLTGALVSFGGHRARRRGRAALPRAHVRAADRDRRRLPAGLATARRPGRRCRAPGSADDSAAREADEGARTLDLRHGKATL